MSGFQKPRITVAEIKASALILALIGGGTLVVLALVGVLIPESLVGAFIGALGVAICNLTSEEAKP